jgi:hypothetical protein
MYIAAYSIFKNFLGIQSSFSSRQCTDKQVDITVVSTASFTGKFPQTLCSLQQYYLPTQPSFGLHALWYVSYQSLSRFWHTDLEYGSYSLSNLEIGSHRVHIGCDQSTGNDYSSMARDPISAGSRGPCTTYLYCELFHYLNWTLILIAGFFVHMTWFTDFDSWLIC